MSLLEMYIIDVIPYFVLGSLISFIISCFISIKRKTSIKKRILITVFGGYMLALLSQTAFPNIEIELISATGELRDARLSIEIHTLHYGARSANIIPFRSIIQYMYEMISSKEGDVRAAGMLNVLGNIAIFIPIGFFLPLVDEKYKKIWIYILIAAIASLLIEICHLFIGRSFVLDDVILNTFGAYLGCLIIYGIGKLPFGVCLTANHKKRM